MDEGDTLKVTYDHGVYAAIKALTSSPPELELSFGGMNEVGAGAPFVVDVWRCSPGISPSSTRTSRPSRSMARCWSMQQRLQEIDATFTQMHKDVGNLADGQKKAATATAEAGTAAGAAAAQWALLKTAFENANNKLKDYDELQQKTAAARRCKPTTAARPPSNH